MHIWVQKITAENALEPRIGKEDSGVIVGIIITVTRVIARPAPNKGVCLVITSWQLYNKFVTVVTLYHCSKRRPKPLTYRSRRCHELANISSPIEQHMQAAKGTIISRRDLHYLAL